MNETRPNTIKENFLRSVEKHPEREALVFETESYSYANLHDLSATFAIRLRAEGVDENSTVQIHVDDLAISVAVMLATACLGARLAERAITDKLPTGFPVTHAISVVPDADIANQILIDQSFSPANFTAAEKAAVWQESKVNPTAPWMIVSTSGTSGLPKAVGLSQQLVCQRSHAVRHDFVSGETRLASLFPTFSRPFFARAMAAILSGATIVEKGSWAFWLKAKTTLVAGTLVQLQSHIDMAGEIPKIPKLEVIGAKMLEADAIKYLKCFEQVDDTYGATETNKTHSNYYTVSSGGALEKRGVAHHSLIEIVDDQGNPVVGGNSGTVRVKTDCAIERYLFNEGSTTEALQEGWFYPGDIACWQGNGVLDVIRRSSSDVLAIDGNKVNAKLIDHVLEGFDGIIEAAVFASPKQGSSDLIAFVVYKDGVNELQIAELAKLACKDQFGDKFAPAKIWPIEGLPRRLDGTPDRDICAAMILAAAGAQQER